MDESHRSELPHPWDREASFTRRLMMDNSVNAKSRFHKFDAWHCLHLGVGKAWVASSMMLLQPLVDGSSIEKRIATMSSEYRSWCRREHIDLILTKFDRNSFGGSKEALGSWNKAAVTSNLLRFLEYFIGTKREEVFASERLKVVVLIDLLSKSFLSNVFERAFP